MTHYIFRGESAGPQGAAYEFSAATGRIKWPMDAGAFLGAAGCWNFCLRIGGRPVEIAGEAVATVPLDGPLFVALDGLLSRPADRESLRKRIAQGGTVVASGDSSAWAALLPEMFAGAPRTCDNPYAAVAYRHGGRLALIAPPRWPVHVSSTTADDARADGEVVFVSGERQTPSRAVLTPVAGAPAVIRRGNLVFLNASPFHALQAWLQGQEDLQPWLEWRHRLFWLDEWVSFVRSLLEQSGLGLPAVAAIPGLEQTCIVLRHDLDYSTDTSYLSAEEEAGIPAVHAVLRDRNAGFWREQLARRPEHEVAFHYNTASYSRWETLIRRSAGLRARPYLPRRSAIVGSGLATQVRWARRNGIGVATLHRHLSFLFYPEWVDAFDHVQGAGLGVLGASSMFRAQVLRWGTDRADGARGTYADHPDAMFPYWLPFKLAHAADGGRLVGGWESASVMELEPAMVERMLDHHIPGLPQRVLTLNFHPAHAQRATFAASGSLGHFCRVLEIIKERRLPVLTLRTVFESLNRFLGSAQ